MVITGHLQVHEAAEPVCTCDVSCSKEISEEVHCHKPLDMLTDMAYCPAQSRVAVGGGSNVKLIDVGAEYGEVAGEGIELPPGHAVEKLGWGQDGQVGARIL